MKAKRLNTKKKAKRIKRQRVDSKSMKNVQVVKDYPDTLTGRTVMLKSLPTNVKRAKKLFKVDKKYKIVKPKDKKINTLMSVNLKGKDGNIYQVQFMHWILCAS